MPAPVAGWPPRALTAARALPGRVPARLRRPFLIAAVAGVALGSLFLWFRDSPLVAVETVTVTGLTTGEAPRVKAALVAAARDMTTLHVRVDEMERAASPYAVVKSIRAVPDFPHGLRIEVTEHRPVAVIRPPEGGAPVPVAADGTLLRGLVVDHALPDLRADGLPAADRVTEAQALDRLSVIAAAPGPLARRIRTVVEERGKGAVALMRGGPAVVLGAVAGLRTKWESAARVLADPSSQGASYVDVRIPERPAAGGLDASEPGVVQGGEQPLPAQANAPGAAPAIPAQATGAVSPTGPEGPSTAAPSATPPTPSTDPQPGL